MKGTTAAAVVGGFVVLYGASAAVQQYINPHHFQCDATQHVEVSQFGRYLPENEAAHLLRSRFKLARKLHSGPLYRNEARQYNSVARNVPPAILKANGLPSSLATD